MLNPLKHLFPKSDGPGYRDQITFPIAACVVLLEMAEADQAFCGEERRHMLDIARQRFGLSADEAGALVEEAARARKGSSDLWRFTRTINEIASPEEKRALMEETWRIVYADGVLDGHEDYLAHKLAELLHLTHKELIAAKLRVLDERKRG